MNMPNWLRAAAALLILNACHSADESQLDIVRGRPVSTDSPAKLNTVQISAAGSSCTASIIGERLILTAAHCVDEATAAEIRVRFFRNEGGLQVDRVVDVSRVQMFKKEGSAFFPNFDIAWLELKETIPAPFKPIEILRDPALISNATPVILAGYGQQADDCVGVNPCSGVLKEGNTQLSAYFDKAHLMSLLLFYGNPDKNLAGACYGDSGGPAYVQINGQWFLAGVTNGWTTTVAPESDGSCASGWDIYTFAGDYLPWLEKTSGQSLMHGSAVNPDRAQLAQVMSGPSNTRRPTTWAEWVNYANHEDNAWYTMDSLLNHLAYSYEQIGIAKKQMTEVFLNPEVTLDYVNKMESVSISSVMPIDLSPLRMVPHARYVSLNGPAIQSLAALNDLPDVSFLNLSSVKEISASLFDEIPLVKQKLSSLYLNSVAAAVPNQIPWKGLTGLKFLSVSNSPIDVSLLNDSPIDTLNLTSVELTGNFTPSLTNLRTLFLRRVTDKAQRPLLDWISHAPAYLSLTSLSLHDLRISQDQIESLPLPVSLQRIDVSGNRLKAIPQLASWAPLHVTSFDNPLEDVTCPAQFCQFDKYIRAASLKEYCENTFNGYTFGYSYRYGGLFSQLLQGGTCETIEATSKEIKVLDYAYYNIDDVRPLALLKDTLETLYLAGNPIDDLSPLAGLERLNTLGVPKIPNVDLNLFNERIGLKIFGMATADFQKETCPIPAGQCIFLQEDVYKWVYGASLGTSLSLGDAYWQTTLVGTGKIFKTY